MELPEGIKNIIFDLGGVLLNIDPQKTIEAFGKLGMKQLIDKNGLAYSHDIFYQMEQGRITSDEFRLGILQLLPRPVPLQKIDDAWTAMLLDFPAVRVRLLQKLRGKYNLYLFSNTNAIHVARFHDIFRKQHGFDVSTLFDKDFYSNEIGYRKPSAESYLEIIRLAGILPCETFFIDDSLANVEAACRVGLKGYWLEPGQKIENLMDSY